MADLQRFLLEDLHFTTSEPPKFQRICSVAAAWRRKYLASYEPDNRVACHKVALCFLFTSVTTINNLSTVSSCAFPRTYASSNFFNINRGLVITANNKALTTAAEPQFPLTPFTHPSSKWSKWSTLHPTLAGSAAVMSGLKDPRSGCSTLSPASQAVNGRSLPSAANRQTWRR